MNPLGNFIFFLSLNGVPKMIFGLKWQLSVMNLRKYYVWVRPQWRQIISGLTWIHIHFLELEIPSMRDFQLRLKHTHSIRMDCCNFIMITSLTGQNHHPFSTVDLVSSVFCSFNTAVFVHIYNEFSSHYHIHIFILLVIIDTYSIKMHSQ